MSGLSFHAAGSGVPVVLVHGWGFHSGVWRGQAEFFQKNFRVVAVDLPGHGASPPASQRLSISFCAKALEELIRERGFTGCHLVGWSLGAEVIVRAAQSLGGEYVRSLTVVGGTPVFLPSEGFHDREAERKKAVLFEQALVKDFEGTRFKFFQSCFNLKKGGRGGHPDPLPSLLEFQGKFLIDKRSAMELLESLYEDDIREEAQGMEFPSLICHGDRDAIIPVEASGLWSEVLVNSRVEIFKDGGHAVFWEEPEKFNRLLMDFFLENA